MVGARRWRVSAVAVALVSVLAAAIFGFVANGRAAEPLPTLKLAVAPKPVVKTGEKVLGILRFSYAATASPTTLTGPYVIVTISPALAEESDFDSTLSSPFCFLQSLSTVRCDLSNMKKGDSRTMFVVVAASGSSITMAGAAFWNEDVHGKNPQPNNTVSSTPTSDSTIVVPITSVNADGKCTVGGSTLDTSMLFGTGNQVATQVSYSANVQGLPLTCASAQDDIPITLSNATCTASPCVGSEVTLPLLSSETPATVIVTFDGSLFPPPGPPPNPNTFIVYEIVSGTIGEPVPFCSTGETTTIGTCKDDPVRWGTRGIQVPLRVRGIAIDPKYTG